jgi:Leucine-rich repeat (LRR) protein
VRRHHGGREKKRKTKNKKQKKECRDDKKMLFQSSINQSIIHHHHHHHQVGITCTPFWRAPGMVFFESFLSFLLLIPTMNHFIIHNKNRQTIGRKRVIGQLFFLLLSLTTTQPSRGLSLRDTWMMNHTTTTTVTTTTTTTTTTVVKRILRQFYQATNGPQWKHQDGWSQLLMQENDESSERSICDCYGILCNNNQQIQVIGLAGNQLQGTIPSELWTVSDLQAVDLSYNSIEIEEWASSSALRRLRLSATSLLAMPEQFSNLEELFLDNCHVGNNQTLEALVTVLPTTLQSLHLSTSTWRGTIPYALGRRLTNLRHLYLQENELSGTLPAILGELVSLQSLDVSDNHRMTPSTLPTEWNQLRSLQTLQLNRLQLQGTIPAYPDLTQLEVLEAMGNALSGSLPVSFLEKRPRRPMTIRLSSNQLTGSIPLSFLNFPQLHIELMDNHITSIDEAFCTQSEWMSGQVGAWLEEHGPTANGCNVLLCPMGTYNAQGRVAEDHQPCLPCPDNNQYMGQSECAANLTMNDEIVILNELFAATGGHYHWNASLVQNWTKQGVPLCNREGVICGWPTPEMNSGVTELRLRGYGLTGTIPSRLYQLPKLRELDVSFNSVEVDFRGIEQAEILEIMKLTNTQVNSLAGIEHAGPLLHELHWDQNMMEGPLPVEVLKQLTSLRKLYLSENRFTGTLSPELFTSLTQLVTLSIHDNPRLAGELPTTLGLLEDLQIFDAHKCSWSGNLPTQLEQLTNLRRLTLSQGSLDGPLLSFPQSRHLSELYLSRNHFTGSIPSDLLGSIEPLLPLRVDFSFNRLTGSIPSQLLQFQKLNLDVVGNDMTSLLEVCDSDSSGIPSEWMNGAVAATSPSCDAIACRPGYASLYGRVIQTNANSTCLPCVESDEAPFYGSIHCLNLASQRERRTLVTFYEATQGTNGWITDTYWLSDDIPMCNWLGVVCDEHKQQVKQLNLEYNGLSLVDPSIDVMQILSHGLPFLEQVDLKGNTELKLRFENISKDWKLRVLAISATNLTSMNGLDTLAGSLSTLLAADNALQGEIPTEVYALTNLKQLFLSYNQLSGSLSSKVGMLSSLESLYWSNNNLSGTLPTELAELTNLRQLIMNENALQGPLPTELNEMSKLEQLWLQQQNGKYPLGGRLPSFANAAQLWYMDLSNNGVSGSIPTNFLEHSQRLADSITILLQSNDLTGTVPTSLTRFSFLYIDLGDNKITDLPPVLCDNTNWMNGELLPGSCDYVMCPPATYNPARRQTSSEEPCIPCPAELADTNMFWGRSSCMEIESEQAVLEKFFLLTDGKSWLNHTHWLSDRPICSWSGIVCAGDQNDNKGVTGINLAGNALRGALPTQVWALPLLTSLQVENNPELIVDFRGTSMLTSVSLLQVLDVANSTLAYGLEGLAHFKRLRSFTATHISGRFPSELLALGQLQYVNVSDGHLIGTLPTFEFPRIPQWKQFYAPYNDFHGSFPESWGQLSLLEELGKFLILCILHQCVSTH